MRSFDWAATPLGRPETWPQNLRTSVGICLNSQFPMPLWWGDHFTLLYNDAFRRLLGRRHPTALGQPARTGLPELWRLVGANLETARAGGSQVGSSDIVLPREHRRNQGQDHFTFCYAPVLDENGRVAGLLTPMLAKNDQAGQPREAGTLPDRATGQRAKVGQRRNRAERDIGAIQAGAVMHENFSPPHPRPPAGGSVSAIVHDFNNLLTAIIGSLDMILHQPAAVERVERYARVALDAAERGETLVRDFMAVKGGDAPAPEPARSDTPAPQAMPSALSQTALGRSVAKVLIVDDEMRVLDTNRMSLEDLGCQVLTARNGGEALEILRSVDGIDLLFSDIVMPGGPNGFQLAREARQLQPAIKILLTSGYAPSELAYGESAPGEIPVLRKPYHRDKLRQAITNVLGHL